MSQTWRWHTIKELENDYVISMAQSIDGELWFGHFDGISIFDGNRWSIAKGNNGLKIEKRVLAMHGASDGSMYVRSYGVMLRYHDGRWTNLYDQPMISDAGFYETSDGSVWIMESHGLVQIVGEQVMVHSLPPGVMHKFSAHEDMIWLINSAQLRLEGYKLDRGHLSFSKPEYINLPSTLQVKFFLGKDSLFHSSHRQLWLTAGKSNDVAKRFDLKARSWSEFRQQQIGGAGRIHGIFVDRNNRSWIWGANYIAGFDAKQWQFFSAPEYEIPNSSLSLFESSQGDLWFYGKDTSLTRIELNNKRWGDVYSGLHFQLELPAGYRWFISDDGSIRVHDYRARRWARFDSENGLAGWPSRIFSTTDNLLWVVGKYKDNSTVSIANVNEVINAAFSDSESKIDEKGNLWARHVHENFASIFTASSIYVGDNEVILGANHSQVKGGLIIYTKKSKKNNKQIVVNDYDYQHITPPIIDTQVSSVARAADGSLWVSSGHLLHVYDQAFNKINVSPPKELKLGKISSIVADINNDLWLSSEKSGVYSYSLQSKQWQHYSTRQGLLGQRVYQLLELHDGSICAVTDRGSFRFDGKRWNMMFSPELKLPTGNTIIAQDLAFGVWLNQDLSTYKFTNANLLVNKNPNWFYRTQRYNFDNTAPVTLIERFNKEVSYKSYNQVFWHVEDDLDETSDSLVTYSYKLDDQNWSDFLPAKSQVFENLPAGVHSLKVRARDADFNIDKTPAEIEFTVVAPLWQQTWFLLSVLFIILSCGLFVLILIRVREKHIQDIALVKLSFFTNISHELKTPLTLILGPLDNLIARVSKQEDLKQLKLVKRNAERLLVLVEQLLDFRKVQSRKMELVNSEVEIVKVTNEIIEAHKAVATQKMIHLSSLINTQERVVLLDVDKYEKILNNLLSNAIKYTPKNGAIVSHFNFENREKERSEIIFTIEDDGIGIAAEDLKNIFDQFYRVSRPDHQVDGSGIGLALTKELVEACGGSISVKSPLYINTEDPSLSKGTKFTVRLPLTVVDLQLVEENEIEQGESESTGSSAGDRESDGVQSILIVEDDEDIRAFLHDSFTEDYIVYAAEDGLQGLEFARKYQPSLVITDLMMPNMNGIELCEKLKQDELISHIPVVMLTAKNSDQTQLKALQNGADDYVTKPFQILLLKGRIQNLINSRKSLREKFSSELMLKPSEVTVTKTDEEFLNRAITLIEDHISDTEFTVKQFASEMNMSHQNLYVKLKALINQTPQDFIRTLRLERGMQLLQAPGSTLTIAEISVQVGFEDPNYFSRRFKKQFGVPPTAVKNYIKGNSD